MVSIDHPVHGRSDACIKLIMMTGTHALNNQFSLCVCLVAVLHHKNLTF